MTLGSIFLSCGHEDPEKPLGWCAHTEEWVDTGYGYEPAILSGSYCSRCFAVMVLQNPRKTWLSYEDAKEAIVE